MSKAIFRKNIKRFQNYNLMGSYVKRFYKLYITLLTIVAFFELVLFGRELIFSHSNSLRHTGYTICYAVLFVASLLSAVYLITQKSKKNNEKRIALIMHIYAFISLAWSFVVTLLDYSGGLEFPAVFFTILATTGGLLVLNPLIYIPSMFVLEAGLIVSMYYINPDGLKTGNIINMAVMFVMIVIISYRTNVVAAAEADQRDFLTSMSYKDVLTGLKNENAYYKYLDELDKKSAVKEFDYAVISMDVNGLKNVDDTYGHRYGAYLISTAGRLLSKVFKNCEVFHTGGDEFVCIIVEEFPNLDKFMKEFENILEYTPVIFEGQELYLSLSRGLAIHKPGEKFNDTFQRADKDLYVNKPLIKEKYNIQGR